MLGILSKLDLIFLRLQVISILLFEIIFSFFEIDDSLCYISAISYFECIFLAFSCSCLFAGARFSLLDFFSCAVSRLFLSGELEMIDDLAGLRPQLPDRFVAVGTSDI